MERYEPGFSMLQALEFVVKEMTPPASDEFRRVLREVSLGLTVSQALTNLAQRMENKDLEMVVTSVNIQYQVGGNLATMLTAITETIRERIRLFQEICVLTTQARYTSYLITLMPVAIGALFFLLNPKYMMGIFTGGYLCIPIGAVIGIILGHIVIRRVVNSIEL